MLDDRAFDPRPEKCLKDSFGISVLEFGFEAIVVGGGAVGLACAAAPGKACGPTLVLEQEPNIGSGETQQISRLKPNRITGSLDS